jgi:hypothetical protein
LALGNISRFQAARTAKGREKMVGWLETLITLIPAPAGDPIGDQDFTWMWRELGVVELRK